MDRHLVSNKGGLRFRGNPRLHIGLEVLIRKEETPLRSTVPGADPSPARKPGAVLPEAPPQLVGAEGMGGRIRLGFTAWPLGAPVPHSCALSSGTLLCESSDPVALSPPAPLHGHIPNFQSHQASSDITNRSPIVVCKLPSLQFLP